MNSDRVFRFIVSAGDRIRRWCLAGLQRCAGLRLTSSCWPRCRAPGVSAVAGNANAEVSPLLILYPIVSTNLVVTKNRNHCCGSLVLNKLTGLLCLLPTKFGTPSASFATCLNQIAPIPSWFKRGPAQNNVVPFQKLKWGRRDDYWYLLYQHWALRVCLCAYGQPVSF